LAGDKLVVPRRRDVAAKSAGEDRTKDATRRQSPGSSSKPSGPNLYFNRHELNPDAQAEAGPQAERSSEFSQWRLDHRMKEMERKLDQILDALKKTAR
jgi:hypothetical protein